MPLKVYQYPKCSTCRNALKWLDANNLAHTDIDITEQPPSKSELNEMLAHYDGDLRRLFNTSDQMYRALKIKDRLPEMKPPEAIDLLAANGMLILRIGLTVQNQNRLVSIDQWKQQHHVSIGLERCLRPSEVCIDFVD